MINFVIKAMPITSVNRQHNCMMYTNVTGVNELLTFARNLHYLPGAITIQIPYFPYKENKILLYEAIYGLHLMTQEL